MAHPAQTQSWWHGSASADDSAGMTLIELLVALVIFAILGVMGYRAISMAVTTRDTVSGELERWRDIANFMQIVETDLMQQVRRPGRALPVLQGNEASMRLERSDAGVQISFLKLDGGGSGPRRRGYRYAEGKLEQLRWPGTDYASPPEAHLVLDKVAAFRCLVVTRDKAGNNGRYESWPDTQAQQAEPVALEIELELTDAGTLRRLLPF